MKKIATAFLALLLFVPDLGWAGAEDPDFLECLSAVKDNPFLGAGDVLAVEGGLVRIDPSSGKLVFYGPANSVQMDLATGKCITGPAPIGRTRGDVLNDLVAGSVDRFRRRFSGPPEQRKPEEYAREKHKLLDALRACLLHSGGVAQGQIDRLLSPGAAAHRSAGGEPQRATITH
jgi:hypothetical protein